MLDLLLSFVSQSVTLYWVFVPILVMGCFTLVANILARNYY